MRETLHFRARSKEELRAILDILKSRDFRHADTFWVSRTVRESALSPDGVFIRAHSDKSLAWEKGSSSYYAPGTSVKKIDVRDITAVMKALDVREPICIETDNGEEYVIIFNDDGSLNAGCACITSEQFMAIAKRRAEVMTKV